MTTARASSPPPLPVRERTRIPEGGLSPMLNRLAAERATGVLLRERGMLHLADGQVVHAESPVAPGLDTLLTTHGALAPEHWHTALTTAGLLGTADTDAVAEGDGREGGGGGGGGTGQADVGQLLVASGHITRGALELCLLSTLFDAAYFVLGPSSAPARFLYGGAHWLGPVHPVPVAAVERETLRRRELLHRVWPDPATDEAPLLRTAHLGDVPRTPPRQRQVLDLVDGTRTAADISRALGRPAFHTLVELRRLAAAGLVTTATTAPPPATAPPLGRPPPTEEPPHPFDAPPPEPPHPPPHRPPPPPDHQLTDPDDPFTDPHITLLRRLRDALEAL
ncbi:hypothetical protein OK074_8329 [Actinobacteria bacterium OK074]|nr:hypothetical protein OK074_8329 [Actinobacteria bacterium OK074]